MITKIIVDPSCGNSEIWDSLFKMAWKHDESMLKDHKCPYKWIQHPDGSKTIELLKPKLTAKLRRDNN